MLYLVGLGAGGVQEMSANALGALRRAAQVLLRTENHPAVASLRLAGIPYIVLETPDLPAEPDARARALAEKVMRHLQDANPVAYAVPGHPLIAEDSVRYVLDMAREQNIPVRIVPSRSFVEPVLEALNYEMSQGLQLIDAGAITRIRLNPTVAQMIYQIETPELAGRVKAELLRYYPPDFRVALVHAAGMEGATEVKEIPLTELDQQRYDPLTTLFVPPATQRQRRYTGFEGLVAVVATLRGPEGCPWDKEQTPQSLKPYLIEEAYEVLEAIDRNDPAALKEELGDLLLQVLMHSQLAAEAGQFTIDEVIESLIAKLISRHPHVFGDVDARDADTVLKNWDRIKREQKGHDSILEGVPRAMPALLRALEVSKRAARAGFEWDSVFGVLDKLHEEETELREALQQSARDRVEQEIGDLLFTVVNIARHAKVNPEESLRQMVDRFIQRFQWMEEQARAQGRPLESLSPDEWEALWQQAKQATHPTP